MVELFYNCEDILDVLKKKQSKNYLIPKENKIESDAFINDNLLVRKCKLFNKKRKI